jgi:hypothetical protein
MPMGYKMINGKVIINEEQAEVVRMIFSDYIAGKSLIALAKDLTAKRVFNANKKANWNHSSVGRILQNVRYLGDELYPRLIDEEIFNKSQECRTRVEKELGRSQEVNRKRNQSVFNGKIRCGKCGETYKKYIENIGKSSEKSNWKCKNYIYKKRVLCRNYFFTDDDLKNIFIEAANQLIKQRWLMKKVRPKEPPKMSRSLRMIEARIKELEQQEAYSSPELPELIFQRAQIYYEGSKIYDYPSNTEKIENSLSGVTVLTELNEELFKTIVKHMTIYKEPKVEVEFINGVIITKSIETKESETKGKMVTGKYGSSKKDGGNNTASD